MIIGIDGRALLDQAPAGVGKYTSEMILDHARRHPNDQLVVCTSGLRSACSFPSIYPKNIRFVHLFLPNKLMSLLQLAQLTYFDRMAARKAGCSFDVWWAPNIGMMHLSDDQPIHLTIHDLTWIAFPKFFSFKQRLWHIATRAKTRIAQADRCIVVSEHTKQDLMRLCGVSDERIDVRYPVLGQSFLRWNTIANAEKALHMQSLRKRYALPDQYFLYLGTLEPRKNIRSAVLAHQLLDDDVRQRFPLILAGKYGWKSASLLRMIRKDPYVQWIGYVAEAEKAPLLAGATALVFPSLYEGYGYPVAEAAALGTPVITSNRSSLPEVAPPGTYFISPYRIEHIRDAYIHSIS